MKRTTKLLLSFFVTLIIVSPVFSVLAGCNNHAYMDCVGDKLYWFNDCFKKEELVENCLNYGLACRNGQCLPSNEISVMHYQKGCFNGSVYWYSSNGSINDLYQGCADSNSCTVDYCSNSKCYNILNCDNSVCDKDSDDYQKYCAVEVEQTEPEEKSEPTVILENLSVSFFAKADIDNQQWEKLVETNQNSTVYFMITLINDSEFQVDNIIVSANIPSEISYLGNLKIDGVAVSGDIVPGIEIGSVSAMSKKTISFEGKTQEFSTNSNKDATAFINSKQLAQSDSVSIIFNSAQQSQASISSVSYSKWFVLFWQRWYMWIIAGVVLIGLFAMIFKKLSSNI